MTEVAGRPAAYRCGMASSTALGEYLRARRELVRPEDVSLPNVGRRRVPGLRREELAMLAGISSDYYLRLEQGRDHHPSAHVLNALARALQLDEHATAHLHSLSQPTVARRRTGESERAPESVTRVPRSRSAPPEGHSPRRSEPQGRPSMKRPGDPPVTALTRTRWWHDVRGRGGACPRPPVLRRSAAHDRPTVRSGPDSSIWGEAPAAGGRYGRAKCDGMERP